MWRLLFCAVAPVLAATGAIAAEGCFHRTYSAEHLLANPKQDVRSISVRLYRDGDLFAETRVRFRVSDKEWHQGLLCYRKKGYGRFKDATMMCAAECDGGVFVVRPRGKSILVTTEGGWIVGEGGCGEPDTKIRRVMDRGAATTTFKLDPAAAERCK